jgi:hypothetical protein
MAPGLMAFLQKGMSAWMGICSAALPSFPIPERQHPDVLPTEIVTVMAQMVLARYEEINS